MKCMHADSPCFCSEHLERLSLEQLLNFARQHEVGSFKEELFEKGTPLRHRWQFYRERVQEAKQRKRAINKVLKKKFGIVTV